MDPLKELHNYNSDMSISQVVKFFERQGISFTKTMIQNYVRIGALKVPYEKRIYREEHLRTLVLLEHLKSVYSLDEIKALFQAAEGGAQSYPKYIAAYDDAHKFWQERSEAAEDKAEVLLEISAFCVAAKRFAQKLLSDYSQAHEE